ncbi:MAG: ATP synthase F1 subunit epsilon [Patescibacteria group bacterium]
MSEKTIKLIVTAPQGNLYNDELEQITATTMLGEITILPNHIPLISILQSGELIIQKDGKKIPFAVYGGFIEIKNNNEVIILADSAEHVDAIDEANVEAAAKKAEEILKEKFNTSDYEDAALNLAREQARLRIVKKYKNQGIRTSHQN